MKTIAHSKITDRQYDILKHALGVDSKFKGGEFYRNRFVTGKGSSDYADCNQLVERGVFEVRRNVEGFGESDIFYATELGKQMVQNDKGATQ